MEIYRSLENLQKQKLINPVITWGVFDGVHIGHQKLIKENVRLTERISGTSVIITFENHPEEVLFNKKVLFITSLEHRLKLLRELQIDVCIVLQFNRKLTKILAEDFLQLLHKKLGMKGIVASTLTKFGKGNLGNIETIRKFAEQNFIFLKSVSPVKKNNVVISSSLIRKLIAQGGLMSIRKFINRYYSTYGTVIKGAGIGREKLGISTANIDPHCEMMPPKGVYATITVLGGKEYFSVTNIGTRPTINPSEKQIHIETHIFGLSENLYGEDIEVKFIKRLRDEKKFLSLDDLREQILKDKNSAMKILKKITSSRRDV